MHIIGSIDYIYRLFREFSSLFDWTFPSQINKIDCDVEALNEVGTFDSRDKKLG